MKKISICFLKKIISFVFILSCLTVSARDIYVSPKGNDANPGTKEKPLKTFAEAGKKALQFLTDSPNSNAIVLMADGVYPVTETQILLYYICI